jgi:hypothetical protein
METWLWLIGAALAVFLMKSMAGWYLEGVQAATTRQCPECLGTVPRAARRCQHCGVALEPVPIGSRR